MVAPLTPARLGAVYTMLAAFPPFSTWPLPPASDMRFKVARRKDCHGIYYAASKECGTPHEIVISGALHHHLDTVVASMAHEMIHLGQEVRGRANRAQHNADFRRVAAAVCRRYGWDLGQFIGA